LQTYYAYLYSDIHVKGNLYIGGRSGSHMNLYLYNGSVEVDGDLKIDRRESWAQTRINNGNSDKDIPVTVKKNLYIGENCYYAVPKGVLTLGGNLSGNGYLQLSGTHKTILNGTDLQIIELNENSYFAYLEIKNPSKSGVSFNRMIKYDTLVRNKSNVSFGQNSYQEGLPLAENEVYDANLYLWDGTLDLNGKTLTVNGDFIAMGGKIDFNGGKLIVNGDFRVQSVNSESEGNVSYGASSCRIEMDDSEDCLLVNGNFYYYPKTSSNNFTDGTIELKGNFVQYGGNVFVGKGNNTFKFTGNAKQTITEDNTSQFFNFINENSEELEMKSSINVLGSFSDETENISGSGTVIVSNPAKVKNGICSGNLQITEGSNLQEDLSVEGTLTINGNMYGNGKNINAGNLVLNAPLYVDKAKIYVSNNLSVEYYGYLIMTDENDYVLVNGNFTFNAINGHSGKLTAGVLELRGDFTQNYYQNFIASGTHTTIFSRKKSTTGREYVQTITFNAYAGTTRFNKIVLKKKDKEYHFIQAISSISNEVEYAIEDDEAPSPVVYIVETQITEKSVSISFGGSEDNNGILGYEVYRDGKLLGVTSNTTYVDNSVDSDMQYTYTVFAFDNERNKASSSPALNIRTKKDNEAPSIPQNLGLKSRTGSSITIEWAPSTDNVKVVGYNVYANGELLADNVKETTYKATDLEKTRAYKFTVEAFDKAGNTSERSVVLESEVKMPKILSVTPDDNQSIGGESIVLNVYFENSGNSTGNKVAVQIKNAEDEWETIVNRLPQKVASYGRLYSTYTWDISDLTGEDSYSLRYVLTDADGNEDTKEVTYIIDKEGPEAPANFKAIANNGNVNISFDASVSADCAGYEIRRATYGEDELICTLSGRYETLYTDKEVNIGDTYEYVVYAFDKFGNKSKASERVSVQIETDKVAPEIQEFNPRAGRVNAEAKFEITARDNKSVASVGIQYKAVDATDWIDVEEKSATNGKASFTFDTTTLVDGEYFFNAYAIDASGNKSTELFTRRYTVDNTGIAKIKVTNVTSGSSFVRIEWEDVTEEDFGYFVVEQLKSGKFEEVGREVEKLGYYVRGLEPDNEYTFRVVGYDDLGNRGIESEEFSIITTEDTTSPTISAVYPESSYYSKVINLAMDAKDDNELAYAVFSYSTDGEIFNDLEIVKAGEGKKEEHFTKDFDISGIRQGSIFIKFVVYDKAGNKSPLTSDGKDLIVEYRIDRTPPSKVSNLQCKANEGYVEIAWEVPSDETDVKGFEIWRADNANGIYNRINDNCSTLNYYDNSVKVHSMYLYKVAAIDLAGNVGDLSDEIIVTVNQDNNVPVIYGIYPYTNSKICANQTFSVTAMDNSGVANVRLEYTQEGEQNYWRQIGKTSENSNYVISNITWDTDKIEEGEYRVRAIATDVYGNESEACLYTFILDKTAPVITEVKTGTGHFAIEVNATLEDDSDYSYMEILRREVGGAFMSIGKTQELSYVDSDVEANKNYLYKVRVYDEAGNMSESAEAGGYADSTDVVAPVAVLPENYIGIVGMELGLDGLASYDNVRITDYIWDMGNGVVITGATPRYTYNAPGNYTIILTVKDAAGNQSSVSTTARIYENTGKGKTKVQVTDESGIGLPYALVYLKLDEDTGLSLKADQFGYVEIVQDVGIARIAAYKQDYLPSEMEIVISEYEVKEYKLKLIRNELIVGKLTVHRMSLEEMQQAGVIFGGANNHTYTFTVELVYQQVPYELTMLWGGMPGKPGTEGSINGPESSMGTPSGWGGGGSTSGQGAVVDVVEEKPIIVTVNKRDSISWLKDMFQVDLTVINMADYQFAIENSTATIHYPNGVSLASLSKGQSKTENLGTIHGQETKTASWVLRGDKSGSYEVSADFKGILMPFETPVSAHFVAESEISVTTGEGIHITIMPESTVDCGGDLYVQYAVANNSGKPLYNFHTTIGPYREPDYEFSVTDVDTGRTTRGRVDNNGNVHYDQDDFGMAESSNSGGNQGTTSTPPPSGGSAQLNNLSTDSFEVEEKSANVTVTDSNTSTQSFVSVGLMPMTFDTLYPGQVYYGTYVHRMPEAVKESEDDQKEYYFRLIDAMAECVSGEDLGVTLSISPIGGHYHREFYGSPENYYGKPQTVGDPVDITSGLYQDEVAALTIVGGQELSYDLSYSSGAVQNAGEIGYGWNSQYEMHLEQRNGMVWLYTSPNGVVSFVKTDALNGVYYGKVVNGRIILDTSRDYSIGEYTAITPGLESFKLVRNQDLTYTLYYPGGVIKNFYSDGKLSQIVSSEKQTISISYNGNNTVIKEDISGKTITAVHNGSGLVSELHDSAGRVTFLSYDENSNLAAIVRPDNTTLRYAYDEKHRIVQASNANGVFVTNEYDDNNRVVNQKDALGYTMLMSYEDYGNYSKKVTVIQANGAKETVMVNSRNAVTYETNANNVSASYIYDLNGNLRFEKDPYNNVIEREYDQNNNMVKVTDKGRIVTTLSYDSRGNVTGVFGSDGASAYYSYDLNNHLVSTTDASGLTTSYTYNSSGQMTSETRGSQGSINYSYTNGMLTSITDLMGNVIRMEYDACGNIVKTTDAKGNSTSYTYDAVGRKLSETDALGNTTYYTYDCNGNCTSVKDALGNVTKYSYDAMSHLVKEIYADGSVVEYSYDSAGNVIKKTMPGGITISYSYDLCDNLLKVSSSDGTSISYTYDSLGQKTSETDEFGRTTQYEYNPNGTIHKTTFADGSWVLNTYSQRWKCIAKLYSDGSSEAFSYDKKGNVTSFTDAVGNTNYNEYDSFGRLIKETDAKGNVTQYTYDANGNCTSKTDATGRTAYMVYDAVNQLVEAYMKDSKGEKYSVKYEYDALGRVIATTDEEGYTTKVTYDALGNVKSTIDANGVKTDITTYDSVGKVTTVKDSDGSVTNYTYDARGNILSAIQNLSSINKSSVYTYDEKGRVVSVKENNALTTKVSYDVKGNVASVTDANGGTTQYKYDNLDRLTQVISTLGNKTSYEYNGAGLVSKLTNARGQETTYTYDVLGRVTSMTDLLGTVNYTYDKNGNLTKVEDSKGIIKREYDKLNRVTSYTDYNGNTIKYAYDELGNLLSITYPGGEVVRYEYYKNGWLKKVVDNNGAVTSYTYNALGKLSSCTRPNNTKEYCAYDVRTGRLLNQREVKTDSNGAFLEEISNYIYTYDASGNVSSVEGFDNKSNGLTSASFKYDAENRLIEYNGKEVRYDADGNMVYGPVNGVMTDLSYDCRNRLIYAGGVRYEYDAENTRIAEETSEHRVEYITDVVSNSLSRVLVKKTYKKTNGVVATNSIDRLYVYGNGLISEKEGVSTLYHHYNNIGSTMKLSDGSGNVIAEYTYGPYGELLSGSKQLTDYLYNGQYGVSTDENGLYYMRQRYYNTEIKRFINQDILTGEVGHSQSMNKYAYVEGNPINLMDPFGLSPEEGSNENGHGLLSTIAHGVFGILGCVPGVVGVVANLADCILYLSEGDYFNAAIAGLSALTLGTATAALKFAGATCTGIKIAKGAMMAYKAVDLVGNGVNLVKSGYEFGKQINNIATKVANGEKVTLGDVGNLVLSGAGTVLAGFGTYGAAKELGAAVDDFNYVLNNCCFVAETRIQTLYGEKNIEDIEEGDYVLAEEPETGEQEYKPVVRTFVKEKDELVHVFVEDEEIIATPEHPFYVVGVGFVLAGDLRVGDILRSSDNENLAITNIEKEYLEEPVKVYNFEVEDFHTYFVSEKSILVHNDCKINVGNNDLIYGPSANGNGRAAFQDRYGGMLLEDVSPSKMEFDMLQNRNTGWDEYSIFAMEKTVKEGNTIHFDLTYMDNVDGILNGTAGDLMNTVTSKELVYIRNNWSRFSNNVKFYNFDIEVIAPWIR
ncbi:intein N-terminal splicing region/RHS repeat-associated core domain-containing protein, partial [Lachnospiraceae bacterium G41]